MKLYKFHASTTDYHTLVVKAENMEQAKKIANESSPLEWEETGSGDCTIDHDLTEVIFPTCEGSPPLDKKQTADLLATALEGGSNYWYVVIDTIRPPALEWRHPDFTDLPEGHRIYDWAFNPGGGVLIGDRELEVTSGENTLLNWGVMTDGMYWVMSKQPEVWSRIESGDYDADDADVWLQLSLYGEVVFA